MYCNNITCKYNQLGMECTRVPYNVEFNCTDRNTDFSKKGEKDEKSSKHKNEKV